MVTWLWLLLDLFRDTTIMSDAGKFKAIGMPIMLVVTYFVAILVTHKSFIRAFHHSRGELINFAMFIGAVAASVLSMFLYFSASWAYGLITTVMCYLFALVIASPNRGQQSRTLFYALAVWFAILIGIPTQWSMGVIESAARNNCVAFYGSKADAMCKEGWLDFVEIVAMVLIAITFLTLLTLMTAAVENEGPASSASPRYTPVGDGDSLNGSGRAVPFNVASSNKSPEGHYSHVA
jgi:hypothetical protein